MADKRITDVDFIESLNSDESFFVNKNNTIKQINKGDIVFDIVNGGTGANTAADARENLGITLSNIGAAPLSHTHNASDIIEGTLSSNCLPVIDIAHGGTGASNGETGLKNLFAAGNTILSANQYGDSLPKAGITGRIFFKRV